MNPLAFFIVFHVSIFSRASLNDSILFKFSEWNFRFMTSFVWCFRRIVISSMFVCRWASIVPLIRCSGSMILSEKHPDRQILIRASSWLSSTWNCISVFSALSYTLLRLIRTCCTFVRPEYLDNSKHPFNVMHDSSRWWTTFEYRGFGNWNQRDEFWQSSTSLTTSDYHIELYLRDISSVFIYCKNTKHTICANETRENARKYIQLFTKRLFVRILLICVDIKHDTWHT